MIFTDKHERVALAHWCHVVANLKPGYSYKIDRRNLMDIRQHEHNDCTFTPADRIMGNIVGSTYTHSMRICPETGDAIFHRHEERPGPAVRRYKAPDDDYRRAVREIPRLPFEDIADLVAASDHRFEE